MFRHAACLTGLVVMGALVGCGDGAKPEVIPPLEPVSGKVTLDGQPGEGVSVTFFPAPPATGNPSSATTDASGAYSLKHRSGKDGIPAGDYIVLFSKLAQPDGSPIPAGKTAADVNATETLPEHYRQMDNLQNAVVVPKGGKSFDFDIKTK